MNKKRIPEYENYFIYDNGDVYNESSQRFLRGSIGEHGYKYFRLSKNNKKKMFYCHRLVAEAFLDNPNNLPVVNHIDGNKLNNCVDNLEWVTYSENTKAWHDNVDVKGQQKREYYIEDLPGEVWKEYSNYLISNQGRIRHKIKNNFLKPSLTCGYYKVRLSNNGLVEDWMIHQLVWFVFCPDNKVKSGETIDHVDGNKINNKLENLRKVTLSENVLAALYETKTNPVAKRVEQFDIDGNFIQEFPSARMAAKALNLDSSTISKVCRGVNKTHGGFLFKYL